MEQIVKAGEIELWSECSGDSRSPALLLVAGANASAMMWPDEFIGLLVSGGLRVIRYDHRDTGGSTCRDFNAHPYSVHDLAADAVAVLDGWNIPRAHVVGLSMGGTIGQVLALDYPDRLLTVTVMLTAALDVDFVGNMGRAFTGEINPDGLPSPKKEVLEVLAKRAEPVASRDAEMERRIKEWKALSGNVLPFELEEFRRWENKAIEHANTWVQPSAHGKAKPVPLGRGKELRLVRTPTLVIQGMDDPLNPPPHGRHIAELIPSAKFIEIEGLGHALPSCIHPRLAREITNHTRAIP